MVRVVNFFFAISLSAKMIVPMEQDDDIFGGLAPIVSEVDCFPIFFHLECFKNENGEKVACPCGTNDCFFVRAVDEHSKPVFVDCERLCATTQDMGDPRFGPIAFHKHVDGGVTTVLGEAQRWVISRNDHVNFCVDPKIEICANLVQQFMFENSEVRVYKLSQDT